MMTFMVGVIMYLFMQGTPEFDVYGMGVSVFMMIMLVVYAIFDFCPSIAILDKFLPRCWQDKQDKNDLV
jgi:hypothetical protein